MNTLTLARAKEAHSAKRVASGRESYQITWRDGRISSGFVSPEQAAEYAVESGSWLDGHRVSDDLTRVYNAEGDRVGEIEEVAP